MVERLKTKAKKKRVGVGGGDTPHQKAAIAYLAEVISYTGNLCVLWPFGRKGTGYGEVQFGNGQKVISVHRWVCEQVNGSPPKRNMDAAHSCGKGKFGCITPRHLCWATWAENIADLAFADGPKLLTASQVGQIRAQTGSLSRNELARQFGVSPWSIKRIQGAAIVVHTKVWDHGKTA
jgi:hypothetical protein